MGGESLLEGGFPQTSMCKWFENNRKSRNTNERSINKDQDREIVKKENGATWTEVGSFTQIAGIKKRCSRTAIMTSYWWMERYSVITALSSTQPETPSSTSTYKVTYQQKEKWERKRERMTLFCIKTICYSSRLMISFHFCCMLRRYEVFLEMQRY